MRLQKLLAEAGLGSRRTCEDLIRAGRVTVDGRIAELGASVDASTQRVEVDGRPVAAERKEYWLLNKPAGILTTASDDRGRSTVMECVPAGVRVFPVGRLDLHSTGVLLLTNDGDLAARLLHPSHHVEKEYVVTVFGKIADSPMRKLRGGIELEDGPTAPARVELLRIAHLPTGSVTSTLRVTIHEGRKRQVRRMFEAVGHRVMTLHRTRFAGLSDTGLALGQARRLTPAEIRGLRESLRRR